MVGNRAENVVIHSVILFAVYICSVIFLGFSKINLFVQYGEIEFFIKSKVIYYRILISHVASRSGSSYRSISAAGGWTFS
jgi:hypothetical protein